MKLKQLRMLGRTTNRFLDYGEIYMAISPSGRKYIGQAVLYLPAGTKWGAKRRWRQHMYEAKSFKNCSPAIDNAIRKYGWDSFEFHVLATCKLEHLDFWEHYFITQENSMHPHGYNLTMGKSKGRQSDLTRERKRQSMYGKNKGKQFCLPRKSPETSNLPKYVYAIRDTGTKQIIGYTIQRHPLFEKAYRISNKKVDPSVILQHILDCIKAAEEKARFNEQTVVGAT